MTSIATSRARTSSSSAITPRWGRTIAVASSPHFSTSTIPVYSSGQQRGQKLFIINLNEGKLEKVMRMVQSRFMIV